MRSEIEEAMIAKINEEVGADPDVELWSKKLEAVLAEIPHAMMMELEPVANSYASVCLRAAFLKGIEVGRDPLKWILPDQA